MAAAVPAPPGSVQPTAYYRLRQLLWRGLDALWPPACGGCQRPGHRFCAQCEGSVCRLGASVCPQCGYPAPEASLCGLCRAEPGRLSPLAGLRSLAFFEGPLQAALHGLKYRRDVILADTLALGLWEAWRAYDLPAVTVVPVPLSAQRLRERGYNQAGLLARGLADLARLPWRPDAVFRTRHTPSQVGLSAEERQTNVAGAFAGRSGRIGGARILLVDDVCTTGATLAACAQALRVAGAAEVWGLTLARARAPRQAPRGWVAAEAAAALREGHWE